MLSSRSKIPARGAVAAKTVALTALATATLAATVPQQALASTAAGHLAGATNEARSDHRLRHYAVSSDLNAIARRWAAHMAAHHTLAHNPNLTRQVSDWTALGENIGVGPSAGRVQNAFMHSSSHRDNILSRSFRQVGVGTARDSAGQLYVDVVFRRPG